MTESQRLTRQIVVALVFFLVVGGISFGIYRGFVYSPTPTPTPNPTINLAPIQVIFTKLLNVENNDYDFLAKVNNSNTEYGSPTVEYEIFFYDFAGKLISSRTGSFYILPGQTKYVVEPLLKFQGPINRADFKIKSVDWEKLQPLAGTATTLLTRNVAYSQVSRLGSFAKVGGEVYNSSDLDLNLVDVIVVVLDANQEPIAVNKTNISTFLARTARGFEVSWATPFVGQMSRVDAEVNANVFENSNFLRTYGGQEKFKQLY
ncbi:MAG: hypothetical protein HYX20_01420 [Candidatus Yanofskybacteria bacterium]|nr:hypothetical protein [Candidatus Yanofskybacteria bacterium]